jgi:imidazolonepropionase-like amidohydrolase
MAGATEHPMQAGRLSRAQALVAYTLDAARMSGLPELARPIEPGRRADLVLLSEDPLRVPDLTEARVLRVFVKGKVA